MTLKHLAPTTALTAVMTFAALPLVAQTTPDPAAPTTPEAVTPSTEAPSLYLEGIAGGVRASDFIGKRVYVTEADTSTLAETAVADADADWEDAGEISDLVLSMNGDTQAVLVDFGGFLGIGEKTVALSLAELAMVPDSDSPDDYFIVFNGTREALEAAPEFDEDMVFEAADPAMPADTTDASADPGAPAAVIPGVTDGTMDPPAEPSDSAATDPAMADPAATAPVPGEAVDLATWAEADLIGKAVYGPNDENVGEISAVSLASDGKIEAAVVDVGGFLGMGEKPVALGSDMLMVVTEADGDTWFRTNATQEQLEALPTHGG